jgi:hypothetical protein
LTVDVHGPRLVLAVVGAFFALMEVADAFLLDVPLLGIAFGLTVGIMTFWLVRSHSRSPVIGLALLGAFEVFAVIAIYPDAPHPPPTWRLALFGVVSVAVLITAGVTLWAGRRATAAPKDSGGPGGGGARAV